MDDLLNALDRVQCKVAAYADDLLLLVEGDSRAELERLGSDGGRDVGVEVSVEKTSCMLLKGRLARSRPPTIRTGAISVTYKHTVKYLGITVGERMSFRPHLDALRAKIVNVVGSLRRVMRTDWGLNASTVRVICVGMFEACVTYGASAWYDVLGFQYGREAVNRCQRIALYACLRVCRTVSTDVMQVLMGRAPWDLVVLRRAIFYKLKKGIAPAVGDLVTIDELEGLPLSRRREIVDRKIENLWQNRWDASSKGRCTYAFIKDVLFANQNRYFSFNLHLGYLLTVHGSLNGYLCSRALSDTAECICDSAVEDWQHVLIDCVIYFDVQKLNEWGIMNLNGQLDVSRALDCEDKVVGLNEFATAVFERRASLLQD